MFNIYIKRFLFFFKNLRKLISIDTELIIIAGDLHVGAEKVMSVLELIYRIHNIPIIYVPGNHEYYGSSFEKENRIFRHNTAKIDGVSIFTEGYTTVHGKKMQVRGKTLDEGDILIIGCAGNIDGSWQDIYQAKHGALNDFYQISDFHEHKNLGQSEHDFLDDVMWANDIPTIVVTHTMPSPKCVSKKYEGSHLNACFANDWEDIIFTHKPMFWICGHTHDKFNMQIDKTAVACNPVGYPSENKQWKWEYMHVYV